MKDVQVMVCFHISVENYEKIENVSKIWALAPEGAIEDMVTDGLGQEFIEVRDIHAHVDIRDVPNSH